MRPVLPILCFLCLCGTLTAAPVPLSSSSLTPRQREQLHAEALHYAQQLLHISAQVSAAYYQPVTRRELIHAALKGLYEAARQPAPPGLGRNIKQAIDDAALVNRIVRARESLGARDTLQGPKALLASCRGMMKALDPHSAVVTEEDKQEQPRGDQPAGFGLEFAPSIGVGPLRVEKVLPGGPAQKAGIRPDDRITHIAGEPTTGLTHEKAAGLLEQHGFHWSSGCTTDGGAIVPFLHRSPQRVTVTVIRPGEETRQVKLAYQESRPESVFGVQRDKENDWLYWADREHKIAHVRVSALGRGTANELRDVLARLEADGMRGLVLDLRWCPGGFLDEAISAAGLFLGDCVITTVKNRSEKPVPYHNTQPRRFLKVPLIVLVNGETSGGAELIAAALADHGRARIAGQRTRGKASVQTALHVGIPAAHLKLTSGEFVRPNGKSLHRHPDSSPRGEWGIRPDPKLESRISADLGRQLRQWWQRQTLRPGSSAKLLPLDDPTADPQRQAALQAVLEMIED